MVLRLVIREVGNWANAVVTSALRLVSPVAPGHFETLVDGCEQAFTFAQTWLRNQSVRVIPPKLVQVDFRSLLSKLDATALSMGQGQSSLDRTLCVAVGYMTTAFCAAYYVNATGNEYGQRVGRAVRDGVRQQLMLFKVCLLPLFKVRSVFN
jgi:hypothetical protein